MVMCLDAKGTHLGTCSIHGSLSRRLRASGAIKLRATLHVGITVHTSYELYLLLHLELLLLGGGHMAAGRSNPQSPHMVTVRSHADVSPHRVPTSHA